MTDWHASAGKRKDNHIRSIAVGCQLFGEYLTGSSTVPEWEVFHGWIQRPKPPFSSDLIVKRLHAACKAPASIE
jgi:hypothetical protein